MTATAPSPTALPATALGAAAPGVGITPRECGAADTLQLVVDAVRCMGRAQDSAGTRSNAWDLADVATAIDAVLPLLRADLRARFGEVPMSLRVELSALSRGADRAREFGEALGSIVPTDAPSPGSLAMHIDEWKRAATQLALELEATR